jgi:hypothetical protein
MNVGLAIKPNTPVDDLLPFVNDIDMALVMTVEPGKGYFLMIVMADALANILLQGDYLKEILQNAKIKQVRVIKKYITSLQLVQLIVPNFIILYFYSPPVETAENFRIICVFIAYVSILIVLFGQFYYNNYVNVKPIKQKVF